MKKPAIVLILILFILSNLLAQVPEIPDPALNDIAMTTWCFGRLPNGQTYQGPIIIFNPVITAQVGPYLTEFFKFHEYGHIVLGHIQSRYYLSNPYNYLWVSNIQELEADTYSVTVLIKKNQVECVRQAFMWFNGVQPFKSSLMHPAGKERAINIFNTAARLGVQLK